MARPSAAFDPAAASYDPDFTASLLGRLIRESVRDELRAWPDNRRVLELGCGTGEDAVWLAQRGHDVTAVDASAVMLEHTTRKAAAAGVTIRTVQLDLQRPGSGLVGRQFDAVLSNFGPLNCVQDRRGLAAWLAPLLAEHATVCAVVMGPLCPWEWLWHGAHLDLRAATRRLRGRVSAHTGGGGTVDVWYPSARRLRREWSPWLKPVGTRGVGVLLPTSDAGHLVHRLPRAFGALAKLERRIDATLPATLFNDHYLATFQRR